MTGEMSSGEILRIASLTYADLTAFLLAKNGYQPVEAELPPDPAAQQHMDLKR